MSFQLSEVVCCRSSKKTLRYNVSSCFSLVNNMDILTANVKIALKAYVNYRFTRRNSNNLNSNSLNIMIKELLEFVCGKSYLKISKKDVLINEATILFEIKKAIIYGATKKLYFNEMENEKDLDNFYNFSYKPNQDKKVVKLTEVELKEEETVKNYFEGLEV